MTAQQQFASGVIDNDESILTRLHSAAIKLDLDFDAVHKAVLYIASERLKLADLELLYIIYPDSRAVVAKAVKDLHDIALNMFRTSYPERVDYLNDIVENPI